MTPGQRADKALTVLHGSAGMLGGMIITKKLNKRELEQIVTNLKNVTSELEIVLKAASQPK